MKLVKSTIVKAFSASKKPGIVSVKRFSKTKVRVRRFSQDGELEFDETVDDAELETEGTDTAIVEEIPAENVAVFSDEDTAVDEVIAEVDGGDATPIIEAKESEGFVADVEETPEEPAPAEEVPAAEEPAPAVEEESTEEVVAEETPAVEEECGDDDMGAILKEASKKC